MNTRTRVWTRVHQNGMMAVVHALDRDGYFAYGALRPGGHGSLGEVKGLDAAKKAADHASECPQPCSCAKWDQ
ncbi:MAG TPA: hypothetical protein VIW45_05790 [Vicinamibacterales bacterium]